MEVCIKQFLRRMVLQCAEFHDSCKLFPVLLSPGSSAAVCRSKRPLFIVSQGNRNNNRRLLNFDGSMMRQYNCVWTTFSPSLHLWSSWCPIERSVQFVPSCSISTSAPFCNSDKSSKNDLSDVDSNTHNKSGSGDNQNIDEMMKRDKELQSILREIMRDFGGPALKIDSDTDKSTPKKNSQLCMPRNNVRHFHTSTNVRKQRVDTDNIEDQKDSMPLSIKDRFKSYDEGDAEVVLDTEELERLQLESQEEEDGVYLFQEKEDEFAGLSFERGKTGVFDMEELVAILRDEKLQDIVVIRVPEELHYCNYMIIGTALSPRHCKAAAEFIRKLYKKKKDKRDPYVLIEGENVHTWKCLDMGNIVLHLFLKSTRQYYDIESLWTLGVEFDEIVNKKPDHYEDLLEQHMQALRSMQPLPDAQQIQ